MSMRNYEIDPELVRANIEARTGKQITDKQLDDFIDTLFDSIDWFVSEEIINLIDEQQWH